MTTAKTIVLSIWTFVGKVTSLQKEGIKGIITVCTEESKKAGLIFNIQKTKIMLSGPITSWQIDGETMENSERLYFLGLQKYCRW